MTAGSLAATAESARKREWGTTATGTFRLDAPTPPGAPATLSAWPSHGSIIVSWSAPTDDGGFPITSYTATAQPGGATCTVIAPATSCAIIGLDQLPYEVAVTATNALGTGPARQAPGTLTPLAPTLPQPPSGLTATPRVRGVHLSWVPSWSGGRPVTGYTVVPMVDGVAQTPIVVAPDQPSLTIDGLDPALSYRFTVAAMTVIGSSGAAGPAGPVVPWTDAVPAAPTALSVQPGDSSVTVGFIAPPANGGAPVSSYTVTATPGDATCTTITTTCVISGLTNGTTYLFTATATNVSGTGPASAPRAATPVAPGGQSFHPLPPTRILDTRPNTRVGTLDGPWTSDVARGIPIAGRGGVPQGATAAVLNVTATDTTAGSFLTLWPSGGSRPTVSSLNWQAGSTVANTVTVELGADGVLNAYNLAGIAHLVIDVVGYFDDQPGDGLTSISPTRVLDSRAESRVGPWSTPWGTNTRRTLTVAGTAGVPANADAVMVNLTITNPSASGWLTLSPSGQTRPLASAINWSPRQTVANNGIVKLGAGGAIGIYNSTGSVDVVLDVDGYFVGGQGALFHPVDPRRVLDTRPITSVGGFSSPFGPGTTRQLSLGPSTGVPAGRRQPLDSVDLRV